MNDAADSVAAEPWRTAVVAEALTWIGTPYHPVGRVKGPRGGVDCATFVAEVFERAGVTSHVDIAPYPPDWHLHQDDERLLSYVLPRAIEVQHPQPADVVTWRVGRAFGHIAIVLPPGWPRIIHASRDERVVIPADGTQGTIARQKNGALRQVRFFSAVPGAT